MDDTDQGLGIPENVEFNLDNLELDHADVVETDDEGLAWLAQTELPATVEGIDHSMGVPADGGEATV